MKILFILLLSTLILSLTACTQTPTAVEKIETGTPGWTISTPVNEAKLYAVESFPITNKNIDSAINFAVQVAESNIQKQLNDLFSKAQVQAQKNLNRTTFETKIRNAVKSQINPYFSPEIQLVDSYTDVKNKQVFVLVSADKLQNKIPLQKRVDALDTQLLDYLHASQNSGRFEQLFSLLPSLPTLEERAALLTKIQALHGESSALPEDNNTLANQMNNRLTRLFSNLIIGVSALTAGSEELEPEFITALNLAGLNTSVRFPDLRLRYYLEPEVSSLKNNMVILSLISDVEIIARDNSTLSAFNIETQATATTEKKAKLKALQPVADKTTDILVERAINHINEVNRLNHSR